MKLIMYSHGGSGNHGCEAIVRGTDKIIRKHLPVDEITLLSYRPNDDKKYLSDVRMITEAVLPECNRASLSFIMAYIKLKIGDKFAVDKLRYRLMIDKHRDADVAISVGGDNYCYGRNEMHAYQNRYYNSIGIPTVLWGCSVEPDSLDKDLADDMRQFSLITARESITFEALKAINSNTVLVADPAFCMDFKQIELPKAFSDRNTVGINASPLILSHESRDNAALSNYRLLIRHILDNTDMTIALIPHVVWDSSNDLVVLQMLYEEFKSDRVMLIEDHSAEELKYIISRCRFFVGARTHATIAAYSTCVPTLVVGYSVKARGIAKDIFGTYENYVLPVQSMNNDYDLLNGFVWISEHESAIRNHLESFMPEYCQRAYLAGDAIKGLI